MNTEEVMVKYGGLMGDEDDATAYMSMSIEGLEVLVSPTFL